MSPIDTSGTTDDLRLPRHLLKITGGAGRGKTTELCREACRLLENLPTSLDGSPQILVLAMTSLNARRLKNGIRQILKESPSRIRVLRWDQWLSGILGEIGLLPAGDTDPGQQFLDNGESAALLHQWFLSHTPVGHPAAHAVQQPSTARYLWQELRHWASQNDITAQPFNQGPRPDRSFQSPTHFITDLSAWLTNSFAGFSNKTLEAGLFSRDSLAQTVRLFLNRQPATLERLSQCFPIILVDEAQDLSTAQHHLLATIARQLMLAGNPALSIRSLRGANPHLFATLQVFKDAGFATDERHLPVRDARTEVLDALADSVLPHSGNPLDGLDIPEPEKEATTRAGEITCLHAEDPQQEAALLADDLKRFVSQAEVAGRPARWDDCAILLRSAKHREELTKALRFRGIPYQDKDSAADLSSLPSGIVDFFTLLLEWEALALPGNHSLAPSDWKKLLAAALTVTDDETAPAPAWKYALFRWQEHPVLDDIEAGLTGHGEKRTTEESLLHWLGKSYATYRETGDWLSLWDEAAKRWIAPHPLWKDHDFAGVVLNDFYERVRRLDAFYRQLFKEPLPLGLFLSHASALWDLVIRNQPAQEQGDTASPKVHLLSFHQAQGEFFPWVAMPFMVAGEFPQSGTLPSLPHFWEREKDLAKASLRNQSRLGEEARLFATGITRSQQRLLLSTHRQAVGGKDPVSPSVLISPFLAQLEQTLGSPDWERFSPVWRANAQQPGMVPVSGVEAEANLQRGHDGDTPTESTSLWAALPGQPQTAVFVENEVLLPQKTTLGSADAKQVTLSLNAPSARLMSLSASSIKTYMTCPRQFFYKHVLRLPQPTQVAATQGSLTHRLMERFNRTFAPGNYTAGRLMELATALFGVEENPGEFERAGFDDRDRKKLASLDPLAFSAFQKRIAGSVADLERKGYFARYADAQRIEAEKKLPDATIEGLGPCRINGTADALIQMEDGTWDILDYKTYGASTYSVKAATCQSNFLRNTLSPLPSEPGLPHAERFAAMLNRTYPTDYQLPLYYLAFNQDPVYRGKIRQVAIQMLRPQFPTMAEQGAIQLTLSGAEIDEAAPVLLADLNRFVVTPIAEATTFGLNLQSCDRCPYVGVCEVGIQADEDNPAEGE